MDTQNPELAVWTTDELVDEVRARSTHAVILLVRDGKLACENTDIITRYLKGPQWALIGLAEVFSLWAKTNFIDSEDADE